MKIDYINDENRLVAVLPEEIDHHITIGLRYEIDSAIDLHKPLSDVVIDFSHVSFMDSSGIGLVLGRSRKALEAGAKLTVTSPCGSIRKVMRMAGLDSVVNIIE